MHEHGGCTHHPFRRSRLILDIDFSGQEAGKQAEGSAKGYLPRKNKRGRQLVRVYASQYDEIVCQWMMPGNTGQEMGWPTQPHQYVRPTVQLMTRTPKKGGQWEYQARSWSERAATEGAV